MSDINNTDLENEEASALFVSAKKKKEADEEARRKAEEEEAKRQAAEAEVRRMEEEVEERKRKAEEEKIALENAMKEEAAKAEALKEEALRKEAEKSDVSSEPGKKSGAPASKPMIIGIAAAAVIIVIILVVVLSRGGSGGGPSVDYSALELNATYASQKEGMDMEFSYPDSLYPEVTEKMGASDSLCLHFAPEKDKEVTTDVIIAKPVLANGSYDIKIDNRSFYYPHELKTIMQNSAKEQLKLVDPDAAISDEYITEYDENDPGKYYYTFSFSSEQIKSGAAAGWLEPGGDDVYKFVLACCTNPKEGVEAVQTLRDQFFEENSDDALEMVGANPPESATLDDRIDFDTIHMGIHVPSDWFIKYPRATNFDLYTDINGAYFYSSQNKTTIPEGSELSDEGRQAVEDVADNETPPGFECESRNKISGEWIYSMTYMAEYEDVIGGVDYWGKVYMFDWTDLQTGEQYFARIVIGCPKKDKDIYNKMIDEMYQTKEDI